MKQFVVLTREGEGRFQRLCGRSFGGPFGFAADAA
jgi:hypothetical protein